MSNDYRVEKGTVGNGDVASTFTSLGAAPIDLRAQLLYPQHCPQLLQVIVATAGTLVFKDRNGHSNTLTLPVGPLLLHCAAATIEVSTMVGSVTAIWWVDGATKFN